ncbi:MAG: hypothetical protein RBU25_10595 [Lentisphaeria bacterium]|jgi:hypothetical protein|nr:hypothetical protein [Lentisphaeria bacterium]
MAKVPKNLDSLSFVEIVMRADAETIKAAYEARVKVDGLLAQREEAYRRIAELEAQVETVLGEEGVFAFPPPPLPVAGLPAPAAKPAGPKPAVPAKPKPAPESPANP